MNKRRRYKAKARRDSKSRARLVIYDTIEKMHEITARFFAAEACRPMSLADVMRRY